MPIKTTHVGSLPRTQDVVDFIFAREQGKPYDPAAFDAAMTAAVSETVRRQSESGIDIVSDGETSKISYATYVKDRYTGFSGDSPRNAPADLKAFSDIQLTQLAQELRAETISAVSQTGGHLGAGLGVVDLPLRCTPSLMRRATRSSGTLATNAIRIKS